GDGEGFDMGAMMKASMEINRVKVLMSKCPEKDRLIAAEIVSLVFAQAIGE
ncbi:hypothetical protein KIPB_007034, partial [Kipferlia bialata]